MAKLLVLNGPRSNLFGIRGFGAQGYALVLQAADRYLTHRSQA